MPVYFAQDNLFNNNPGGAAPVTTTTTTQSPAFNFDPFVGVLSDNSIRNFLLNLNSFTLAWCIFYSLLFVADFFFYRLKYTDGDLAREKIGVNSLVRAFNIWFGYLFCLIGLIVYNYAPVLGVIVIVGYFFKLLSVDLPMILDIIHDYIGLNGVHTTYKKMVAPIRKLLRFNFKK